MIAYKSPAWFLSVGSPQKMVLVDGTNASSKIALTKVHARLVYIVTTEVGVFLN